MSNDFNFSDKFFDALSLSKKNNTSSWPCTIESFGVSNDELEYLKMDFAVRTDTYSSWSFQAATFQSKEIALIANCYFHLFINPFKAMELAEKILKECSLSSDLRVRVLYWRMDANFLTGNYKEGEKLLKELQHIDIPSVWKAEILAIKALCLYFLNDLDGAMSTHFQCQEELNSNPDSFLVVFNASMALRVALKKFEPEYFEFFSQVLVQNTERTNEKRYSLRIHGYKALLLVQMGDKSGASEEWEKAERLLPDVEMIWEKGQYFLMRGLGSILSFDKDEASEYLRKAEEYLVETGSPLPYIADLEIAKLMNNWQTLSYYHKGLVPIQLEIGSAISSLVSLHREPRFSSVRKFFEEAIDYCNSILYGSKPSGDYLSSIVISVLRNSTASHSFTERLSEFSAYSKAINKIMSLDAFDLNSINKMLEEVFGFHLVIQNNRFLLPGNEGLKRFGLEKIISFANRILAFNEKIAEASKFENLVRVGREVGHDIQSPLTILKNANFEFKQSEHLDLFSSALKRIEDVSDLLIAPKFKVPSKLALKELLMRAVKDKNAETPNFKVFLDFDIDQNMKIDLPDDLLLRIISNLLNNSFEAGANSAHLSAFADAEYGVLLISDNGPGFSDEFLSHFSRSRDAFTTKTGGLGIGLSSARKYIQDFAGDLNVSNANGALIKIHLPLVHRPKLVVHLEDDKYISKLWASKFASLGILFESFREMSPLVDRMDHFSKDSMFFLDVNLENKKGAGLDLAKELFKNGFQNIYLATGSTDVDLDQIPFLKGVVGKMFPEHLFTNS